MATEEVTQQMSLTEKVKDLATRKVSLVWFFILLFAVNIVYLLWAAYS